MNVPSVQYKKYDSVLEKYIAEFPIVNGDSELCAPFGIAAYEFFDGVRYVLIADSLVCDYVENAPAKPVKLKDDQLYRCLSALRDCGELTLTLHRDYYCENDEGEGFDYFWYQAESASRILI